VSQKVVYIAVFNIFNIFYVQLIQVDWNEILIHSILTALTTKCMHNFSLPQLCSYTT